MGNYDDPQRIIWCVELDKARAQEVAAQLRSQGRRAAVHARMVCAEGINTFGYVVMTDKLARSPAAREGKETT